MDISELVEQIKKGDNKSFDKLYKLTEKEIWFTCISFLRDETTAQDVMQDTYITAFLKIKSLKKENQFKSWLNRIAVNKCKDYLKGKGEIQLSDEILENEVVQDEVTIPEEYITNNAKREIILKLMEDTLSHAQYQTVFLFYFSEMSISEIAEVMEGSEGTVKSRLNSSRAKIKTAVEKYEEENNDRLHGVVFVPLFGSIFKEEAKNITVPKISLDFLENPSAVGSSANGAGKIFKAVMSTAKTKAIAIACCATMVCGTATALIICVGCNPDVPTSSATEETTQSQTTDEAEQATVLETVSNDVVDTVKDMKLKVDEDGKIVDEKGNEVKPNEDGEVEITTESGEKVKITSDEVEAVNNGSNVVVTTAPKDSNNGNTNTNKGNSNSNNSSTGKGNTNNSGSNSGGSSSAKPVQKPTPKPTQKPAPKPTEREKVWVDDYKTVKTWVEPVTEKVWVDDYKTVQTWVDPVTHEEPVYKWVGYDVCNQCGARLNDVNELMDHFFDSDTCVSYKTCKEKVQTGTKTVTDKEGYYKTETVKDGGHYETKTVKEGYYKTEKVKDGGHWEYK